MLMPYQAVSFHPKPCASRRIVASCVGLLTLSFVFYNVTANLPPSSAQVVLRANKADRLPSVSALAPNKNSYVDTKSESALQDEKLPFACESVVSPLVHSVLKQIPGRCLS